MLGCGLELSLLQQRLVRLLPLHVRLLPQRHLVPLQLPPLPRLPQAHQLPSLVPTFVTSLSQSTTDTVQSTMLHL